MPLSGNLLIGLSPTCVVAFLCFSLITITNVSLVDGKICQDIDIRNNPRDLNKLRDCTTIMGSLSIVLIEKLSYGDLSNYTYPELREITGYLLFFRVFGIKSFRNIFPNLMVIRGERLITHYALIIYDMPGLSEIGLTSLIKIQRGYVMIRYCPMLCYIHTINWEAITQVRVGSGLGNYLDYDSFSACPSKCPEICATNNCWNNKNCQIFETDKSTIQPNVTCHEECLGNCVNASANGCLVCKHLQIMKTQTCVAECPKNLFVYSSFCVEADYCIKMDKKPIMGECRHSCPLIISEANVNISSIEQCARECPGTEIDSLATSDLLRGCQIVRGDIFIRLQSGVYNTMEILERNLGDIEEIEGILKVHRSPVITSLSFFRSLRVIRGTQVEAGKYTFIVMSNENLQELWNFDVKRTLELSRGNLLVHFNSKLCLKKIYELQQVLKTNTSADFISPESNGYEQTCVARQIVAWSRVISSTQVEILWHRINVSETEKVIGYEIAYIASREKNVSRIGIDTCIGYGWETHIVLNVTDDPLVKIHSSIISELTPYTQYAYYVKTSVVQKAHEEEKLGVSQGLSNILYFQTTAEAPTYPVVETQKKTSTSITLTWQPMFDNEWIEYYKCDIFIQKDEHELLDTRDYCENPRVDMHVSIGVEISPSAMYQSCNAEFEDWKIANPDSVDPEYEWKIHRKAHCAQILSRQVREKGQSQIMKYVKNHEIVSCNSDESCQDTIVRRSRQIHSLLPDDGVDRFRNSSTNLGLRHLRTIRFPSERLNATIYDLLPYTLYIFQFFACNRLNCSSYYFYYDRTESSVYADSIPSLVVAFDPHDSNMVHLDFSEPPQPNGLTVAFEIEQHELAIFNATVVCITRKGHYANGKRYTFKNLKKGQHSFRVRSVSLAMTGAYSEYKFINILSDKPSPATVVGTVSLLLVCIFAVSIMVFCFMRYKRRHRVCDIHTSRQNILMEMEEFDRPQEDEIPSFFFSQRSRNDIREVF
ncbi:insulin-like receptor [Contarinia nasturtii]|uniref:insulin-like receptor n=1 Tax=Contarinia nasturtii TaxID=265458 RepID=UPI0012D3B7DE|nr:insulin-like receptor [Contarinia nasturtii]XP_031617137.1 insulin-like receptor [Contarinia nasturtii]XP_031617138.1 insulin-like receptor [Contarinia nasturtii]